MNLSSLKGEDDISFFLSQRMECLAPHKSTVTKGFKQEEQEQINRHKKGFKQIKEELFFPKGNVEWIEKKATEKF